MAAITVCEQCQSANHSECKINSRPQPDDWPEDEDYFGALICICPCRRNNDMNLPGFKNTTEVFEYLNT